MITHKVGNFQSYDKSRSLFYQSFSAKNPKAKVIITHGLGEHSGAYQNLAKFLCECLPLKVVGWDLSGHGRSDGKRGYVGDIEWLTKDLIAFLELQTKEDSLKFFTLSHSLGGLINVYAEQEKSLDRFNDHIGSIFSNPCIQLNFTPPKWKTMGAKTLAQVSPWVTLGNEIKVEDLSSLESYLQEHAQDIYRHKKISPRLYLGMLDLMAKVKQRAKLKPSLCLLSKNDPICSSKAARFVFEKSAQISFFDESKHEVLNDKEHPQAFKLIKEFINEHMA